MTQRNPTAACRRAPALALAALLWAGLGLAGCYHSHGWHHDRYPHDTPHHGPHGDHHDDGHRGHPYPDHHRWR